MLPWLPRQASSCSALSLLLSLFSALVCPRLLLLRQTVASCSVFAALSEYICSNHALSSHLDILKGHNLKPYRGDGGSETARESPGDMRHEHTTHTHTLPKVAEIEQRRAAEQQDNMKHAPNTQRERESDATASLLCHCIPLSAL